MQCVYMVRGSKTHYFPHNVHYCFSSMPCLSEMHRFLQSSKFWEAMRVLNWPAIRWVVIGRIPQVWDGNVTSLTKNVMPFPGERRPTIKYITNKAFVASSGYIITDYNTYILSFHINMVNIIMSAFVIGETTNNKHYTTQLKTLVWIVSSRNLLGCESEASDCPCKGGIAPLYRNILCASLQARLLSCQVQDIVLGKLRRTHSNIWPELFWNSVVNTCVKCCNNLTTDF